MEEEITLQDRELIDLYGNLSNLEKGSKEYMECIRAIQILEQSLLNATKESDENEIRQREMELKERELGIKDRECDLREREIKVANRSSWRDFFGGLAKVGIGVGVGVFSAIVQSNIKDKELESSEKGYRVENKSKVNIIGNFPKLF